MMPTIATVDGTYRTEAKPARLEDHLLEADPMAAIKSGPADAKCDAKYCEGGYSDGPGGGS